ncbi:caspase family protein [Streptomyces ureilyticus]|uniref:Caspase family protein n=1 Tax=Streptomyces ureilyticus TaxID=1775131 RepID=A0ABX0DQH7_9ACTN|nr:caspase family protein [Streptomyces ureilyticus]NGO43620.1 caspase family protein [Streptomyces ureilyticus]
MTLPDPAASRAVLIGVDTYTHLDDLPSVTHNLAGMTALLTGSQSWGLAREHCVVLSGPESHVRVLDAVSAAAEEATDALLVYFAGHGLLSQQSSLHLGLPNTHPERLWDSVAYDQLRPLVHACRARRSVVVLDCCYGGMAMRGFMGEAPALADLTAIEGTYLLTASSATRTAMAPEDERYTAFTGELLAAAEEGVPDGPDILDMGTVFLHVRRKLLSKSRPEPQQWARDLGQHIALVRNTWTPAPSPQAEAYATALREAVERAGADVSRLPDEPHPVRRYLSGERVAPREFVDALGDHGVVLPEAELTRLHALRRAAQRSAPDMEVQLLYWREEVQLLRSQLEHAGGYSHAVEAELAEAEEQLRWLRTELGVLQRQLEELSKEREPERAEEKVEVAAGTTTTVAKPPGSGGRTAPPSPPPAPVSATGWGLGALAVIVVLAVLYTVIVWLFSLGEVSLAYDSGRKPALAGQSQHDSWNSSTSGPTYVWDVTEGVESTFQPDEDGATDRLLGDLTVRVPTGCEERKTDWVVSVDGERIGHGTLTGKPEHTVKIDHALAEPAGKVSVNAWWDGGSGSCESFGLVWKDPRLSKSFDFVA